MPLTDPERRILRVVQKRGRISNVELAQATNMSETQCLRRTRQLEDAGVIRGYRAVLDRKQAGSLISAFVLVDTDQRTETDQRNFMDAVLGEPQVISCAAISGAHDFILEVVAADMEDLADLTMTRLLGLPTVRDVASSIVYRWIKEAEPLPV